MNLSTLGAQNFSCERMWACVGEYIDGGVWGGTHFFVTDNTSR